MKKMKYLEPCVDVVDVITSQVMAFTDPTNDTPTEPTTAPERKPPF